MKNPVTFSITEARKVQKKRQIRQMILLCAVIFLLLGAMLVIRVLTMKQQADQLFPSDTTAAATSVPPETGTTSTSVSEETSSAAETAALTQPPTEASSGETSAPDASSGTDSSTAETTPTPPPSTAAPTLAPEADVFIPDTNPLQTTTHKIRDSAYHELQKSVQALINTQTGVRCGFYYANMKNGEEFGYNDMVPFVAGSAMNLPINITLYEQAKTGGLKLSEIMTYGSTDTVSGSGTIQNTVIGSQHYIRELAGLSVTIGDNTASSMLMRRLGGIDLINNDIKLISDVIDFRTSTTYTDYAGVQQSGMNRTSAQDMAKYMQYFYRMYLAYPSIYQPLFNDLAHTTSDWGVAGNLPSDILVCHKTGSDAAFKSETDVALIFAEEPYVLCVTVESADPAAGKLLQQQLGDLVYAYLHGCYS